MMNSIQSTSHKGYQNVMELLVAEEVKRQLNALPSQLAMYIRNLEVETYALNRLPSLYASSEKGLHYQCQKAELELQRNISIRVRQAFSAVQADPIRRSDPLSPEKETEDQENAESQAALHVLRDLLQQSDLSWTDVVQEVKNLLTNHPQQQPPKRSVWRPGTHGKATWQPNQKTGNRRNDWNNPLYCQ